MIISDIKGYSISKLSPPLIMLSIAIAILIIIIALNYSYVRSYQSNHAMILQINNEMLSLDKEIQQNNEAYVVWKKLQERQSMGEGNKGLMIEAARAIIEDIRIAHKIERLDIKLSSPRINPDYNQNKFVNLEEAEVSMSFSSYSDENVFAFINDLLLKMPGILQVVKLDFFSPEVVDENLLNSIRNGNNADIIKVQVDFLWRDFKDIKTEATTIDAQEKK